MTSLTGLRNKGFQIVDSTKDFNGFEVYFVFSRFVTFSPTELRFIMEARLDQIRGNCLNLNEAQEAAYMKLAFILGSKHNFTSVPTDLDKHFRPVAPFKNSSAVDRRSVVLYPQLIHELRTYERVALIQASPHEQSFLYCEKRRRWTARHHSDALVFFNRFDCWTLLGIVIPCLMITLLSLKVAPREGNPALILLAPLVAQSHGNVRNVGGIASSMAILCWIVASMFISISFLGGFDSLLIAPAAESRIETFRQLFDEGYQFVFHNDSRFSSTMYVRHEVFSNDHVWARILDTADLIDESQNVLARLRLSNKKALLKEGKVLEVIKMHMEDVNPAFECFIGDEKLYLYNHFWAFRHPYETELRRTFDGVVESGIYKLMQEIYEFRDLQSRTKYMDYKPHQNSNDMRESATLFSMQNPQASVIFVALLLFEGSSFLILVLEWIAIILATVSVELGDSDGNPE